MSKTTAIETGGPLVAEDLADGVNGVRPDDGPETAAAPDVVVYRIRGAFFFGASATMGAVLDQISESYRVLVIDLSAVPFLDSTAANMIEGLTRKAQRRGVAVVLTGTGHDVRQDLFAHGLKPPLVRYAATIDAVVSKYRET
ncbi:MAG: sodium-independent anion transporter [Rhodospirillaceae bacterium]